MKEYPRILVISNNSFSKTSSNGRSLGNLFIGWPKDKIAQFCISTTEPDYDICDNYYLLTDKSLLNAFKRFGKGKRCEVDANLGTAGNTVVGGKKIVKTPLIMPHYMYPRVQKKSTRQRRGGKILSSLKKKRTMGMIMVVRIVT